MFTTRTTTIANDDGHNVIVPAEFVCPITHQIMRYPMMSRLGQSYERHAILEWIAADHDSCCPVMKVPLSYSDLISNRMLAYKINAWRMEHNIVNDTTPTPTNMNGSCRSTSGTSYPSPDSLLDFVSVAGVDMVPSFSSKKPAPWKGLVRKLNRSTTVPPIGVVIGDDGQCLNTLDSWSTSDAKETLVLASKKQFLLDVLDEAVQGYDESKTLLSTFHCGETTPTRMLLEF
jgi:hypothetical protein